MPPSTAHQSTWTRTASVVAIGAGAIALLGWALGEPVLTGASRGLPPLAPLTAFSLLTAGGALLVLGRPLGRGWERAALGAALAVLCALGALVGLFLQEGAVPHPARADIVATWSGQPRVLLRVPPTVATSGALVLLSASILCLAVRRRSSARLAQSVAIAPLLVALLTATPLVVSDPTRAREIGDGAMPANAALLVLLVALGVVLARPERGAPWGLPLRTGAARVLHSLLPAVVLVPTMFGWLGAGMVRPERSGAAQRAALLVAAQVAALAAFVGASVRSQQRREAFGRRSGSNGAAPPPEATEAMDARAAHRQQLQHILRVLPAPFLVLDGELRVTYANPEAERFFRRPTGGLTGLRLAEVVADDAWPHVRDVLGEVRESREHVTVTAQLGPGREAELRAFPSDDGVALFVRELPVARLTGESDARG